MKNGSEFDWFREVGDSDIYRTEVIKNRLALNIERLMEFQGLKKKDLAEKLGQSPASISKMLRGDANLKISTIVKIASALDASVNISLECTAARTYSHSELVSNGTDCEAVADCDMKPSSAMSEDPEAEFG